MLKGWIGVDLDGTLAVHEDGWEGITIIGAPIAPMVERVKRWRAEGTTVKIMTARAAWPYYVKAPSNARCYDAYGPEYRAQEIEHAIAIRAIEDWCKKHVGEVLPITDKKDPDMIELWDDRAVQVIRNTGLTVLEHAGKTEGP